MCYAPAGVAAGRKGEAELRYGGCLLIIADADLTDAERLAKDDPPEVY